MIRFFHIACFFLFPLFCSLVIPAEQNSSPTEHPPGRIYLDVVVTAKSGPPLVGLHQDDFTLLDNNEPQNITSFKAVSAGEAGQSVILVLDAVNAWTTSFMTIRTEVGKFLHADEGHLAYPTALATFTDKGIQLEPNFSTDGNALGAKLDQSSVGARGANLTRSGALYGQAERLRVSLQALDRIVAIATRVPGRKLIIWVSPGWPFIEGARYGSITQQQIFNDLVRISNDLLRAHVTLYGVDPVGVSADPRAHVTLYGVDPVGASTDPSRGSYYKQFLKGVSKPSQAQFGNLSLQVLAVRSGGLAFPPSNDIARALQECLQASAPYYQLSFDPATSKQAGEYHHLEIKLGKSGLIARTFQGYYAQP